MRRRSPGARSKKKVKSEQRKVEQLHIARLLRAILTLRICILHFDFNFAACPLGVVEHLWFSATVEESSRAERIGV